MIESELFAALERTADAAYTVTEDGEICSWSAAAERLFGYPANEVLGRKIDDVLQARDILDTAPLAGGHDATSRRWDASSGGIPNFDLEVRIRSGERIWVNVSTILIDNPRPGRRLFIRLARGIEHRRRNEELLHRFVAGARQVLALVDEPAANHAPVEVLSEQERRILQRFANGESSATIVRKLRISPQTLRNHLHHINVKLRTRDRLAAVMHARQRGLIE
jgi:PAS domain S-box-containing protein